MSTRAPRDFGIGGSSSPYRATAGASSPLTSLPSLPEPLMASHGLESPRVGRSEIRSHAIDGSESSVSPIGTSEPVSTARSTSWSSPVPVESPPHGLRPKTSSTPRSGGGTVEDDHDGPPSTIERPGLVARLLLLVLHLYKRLISPLLPPACRFYPTCSEYALGAVRQHGALRGAGYAMRRVCRCHPWNPGGHDPVPGPTKR